PDLIEPARGRLLERNVAAERRIHPRHVEESRLPGEDVETHGFMEKPHQPLLGEEGGAVSVRRLPQRHHPRGADPAHEGHEIREGVWPWRRGLDRKSTRLN